MKTSMSEKNVKFCVTNISSYVKDIFCVLYLTCASSPRMVTTKKDSTHSIELDDKVAKLGLVTELFCSRLNDDEKPVTQFLGSALLDLSQVSLKEYHLTLTDSSSRPPVKTGYCTIRFTNIPTVSQHLSCQGKNIVAQMFQEAEANLRLISPFHPKGLQGIKDGLKMVHSPYYVNHMGVTLPSGAFCMMNTMEHNKEQALKSHGERLQVSLKQNHISEHDFVRLVADMMTHGIHSKHMRCLNVVADTLTLHARCDINYTPDVQLLSSRRSDVIESKGTERWELPREPTVDGGISYSGDCEDFAREVYQQAKEIRTWVSPMINGTILESLSAILHMYVPTIQQGAVDSSAHNYLLGTVSQPYLGSITSETCFCSKMQTEFTSRLHTMAETAL